MEQTRRTTASRGPLKLERIVIIMLTLEEFTKIIKESLIFGASGRTMRYFIKSDDFDVEVENYAYTCAIVMNHFHGDRVVEIRDEYYRPSSFPFFSNIALMMECSTVWSSKMSAEVTQPYQTAQIVLDDRKHHMMTPSQMASFARRFNENQKDEVAAVRMADPKKVCCVDDFEGLTTEVHNMMFMRDSGVGSVSANVAYLLDIRAPYSFECISVVQAPNEDVINEWFIWKP